MLDVDTMFRIIIVTCDVGVSLHFKTHSMFMKYSKGTSTQRYAYHCFLCFFYNPYMSLFNSKHFFIHTIYIVVLFTQQKREE